MIGAITGGLVLDGTGAEAVAATVLVDDGRITGLLPAGAELPPGREVIDAGGNIVAPGFIDLHSHADFSMEAGPEAVTQLYQGVTTLVTGNCGWSPFPITDLDQMRAGTAFLAPENSWSSQDSGGFADVLDGAGLAINIALQVGHSALRLAVLGGAERAPSEAELEQMKALLRDAAEQGAVGFSTGLIYAPGTFAEPSEVAALVATAAEYGLLYSTHIRNEGVRLLEALDEAIEAARAGGAMLQVSHLKAMGPANHGKVHAALERMDEARADGVDVACDVYPYTASSTTLTARLPTWTMEGGNAGLLARLADATERTKVLDAVREQAILDPDNVVIASLPPGRYVDCRGLNLAEIGRRDGVDGAEAALRVLENHQAAVSVVNHGMSEDDVVAVLRHPWTSVASDGWILRATGEGHPHPRSFGTFPRVLGRYARDEAVLTLPEAVRRMTSLPASRLGLDDRGVVKPGAVADLVVLDPERVADRSTYDEPWQLSVGIEHVLVAGEPVLRDGVPTANRPGRVLRKG
ncbi:N-acyl-D-amino-acid deacylase [Kribbella orskensis]|uniref:N-acyl-D-amino-acid deacylase n=1 Tax=Kribbella orskensis TaxID=2512216 RepID=A0ABY2BIH6_9ACTN|nr:MULTISPECIES: D-aminoacylase [Kribbella]TCN37701.1 N-acyl-D-amino-acid deacylase [Kribbella sp. VKM Ac-2500]TCO18797.1 N-acyl-D-amino-acid deacylase [Kribbella orskensis]